MPAVALSADVPADEDLIFPFEDERPVDTTTTEPRRPFRNRWLTEQTYERILAWLDLVELEAEPIDPNKETGEDGNRS